MLWSMLRERKRQTHRGFCYLRDKTLRKLEVLYSFGHEVLLGLGRDWPCIIGGFAWHVFCGLILAMRCG